MRTLTRKLSSIVIAVFLLSCSSAIEDDALIDDNSPVSWEETSPFPGYMRRQGTGFWIGDKFYTGFGFGYLDDTYQTLDNLNDFYQYNSATDVWTKKTDFPDIGRFGAVSFSMGGKGYVGFGKSLVDCNTICSHVYYRDLWEYDPVLNSWNNIGTYDQIAEGETTFARSYVVGTKVYLTFGYDLWVFDSSDKSLAKVGALPEDMILSTGFVLNGKIYVGTGGIPDLLTAFYEFNPNTNSWTKKADLPGSARRSASAFSFNGKGYVLCGEGRKEISPNSFQSVGLKDVWEYDPIANAWTATDDYPGHAFIYQISASSNDRICVGTGDTGKDIFYGRDFWIIK